MLYVLIAINIMAILSMLLFLYSDIYKIPFLFPISWLGSIIFVYTFLYTIPLLILNLIVAIFFLIKYKNYLIFAILLMLGIIIVLPQYDTRWSPDARQKEKQQRETNSIQQKAAKERYLVLSERFKNPQKVLKVHNKNTLFIDETTSVIVPVDHDYDKREEFEEFANKNLIGKEIMIELPPIDFFIKNYCCYGKGSSVDNFWGNIYYEGKLINKKIF